MSTVHSLKAVQKIPASLEQVWSFFSDPANLLAITPPFLKLHVTNEVFGHEAYAGQVITRFYQADAGLVTVEAGNSSFIIN